MRDVERRRRERERERERKKKMHKKERKKECITKKKATINTTKFSSITRKNFILVHIMQFNVFFTKLYVTGYMHILPQGEYLCAIDTRTKNNVYHQLPGESQSHAIAVRLEGPPPSR